MDAIQNETSRTGINEIDYKIDWMKRKIKEYEEAKENRDNIDDRREADIIEERLEKLINKAIRIAVVNVSTRHPDNKEALSYMTWLDI